MQVQITVQPGHLARVGEVAAALREAGLRNAQVLDAIGVITGDTDDLAPLEQVEGVDSVERSGEVGVPPPDAPIQ